jgi:hypothetical protein
LLSFVFQDDYLVTENGTIPVRWVAPESVRINALMSLEIRQTTKEGNVWTYGILLWELLEMGGQPYEELMHDTDVISRVIGQRNHRLKLPTGPCPYKDRV